MNSLAGLFDAYPKASSTKIIAGLLDAYSLLKIGTYKLSSVVSKTYCHESKYPKKKTSS